MNSSPVMNIAKGVALGMVAGMAVGYAGKKAVENNPKLKRKANRAIKTMSSIVDTAQYMLRQNKGSTDTLSVLP